MQIDHHSIIGHTAYTDLLRSHLDAQVSDIRGIIERKTRQGRTYLYDRYRLRRGGTEALKARKDRAQAAFLVEALAEDRPDDLAEAYAEAQARGAKWRQRLAATLDRMPETRATLARVSRG